ncbi:MAG TPA: TIGR00725 family protein [bacterium]|nr:TIGR00725 family protein [bacterium]
MKAIRIAVIGQSGSISPAVDKISAAVGREIAVRGGILFSGGRDGVMMAASRGAQEAGGITVGILPGDEAEQGNPYLSIPITTGFGLDFRSLVLIHSADAVIMIGGKSGTLRELFLAYHNRRPVVVLTGSGGWADQARGLLTPDGYLDNRCSGIIRFAASPESAVDLAWQLGGF